MEFLMDPAMWVGLLPLVVLEIVLGIDNLVFIAILANKLPPKKRDRARVFGLVLALLIRLGLLSLISWIITLTRPLFRVSSFSFSGRDLILLLGGVFLLFKGMSELHERLANKEPNGHLSRGYASFWIVVLQIVILDVVFSLDALTTAIGIVNRLPVMMIAVVIAMVIMLLASRSLTRFLNHHQTVMILCLGFLLIIGLSLIAEGFGLHIPKGYLYAAIGFSILIELFNQITRRNFVKSQSIKAMRTRTTEVIMLLMRGRVHWNIGGKDSSSVLLQVHPAKKELHMIIGVLSIASCALDSIIRFRNKIFFLNYQISVKEFRMILMNLSYNVFPIYNGELDQLISIFCDQDLMAALFNDEQVKVYAVTPAIMLPKTLDVLNFLLEVRCAKGSMVMASDEFAVIQRLVIPLDVLAAIVREVFGKMQERGDRSGCRELVD